MGVDESEHRRWAPGIEGAFFIETGRNRGPVLVLPVDDLTMPARYATASGAQAASANRYERVSRWNSLTASPF